MISELRRNIDMEIKISREISALMDQAMISGDNDQRLLKGMIDSLIRRLKLINNSVPDLLKGVSLAKPLPGAVSSPEEMETKVERVHFKDTGEEVALRKGDKEKYFEELSINESFVKKLKKRSGKKKKEKLYRRVNHYAKFSNKFFLKTSEKLIEQTNYFRPLREDLRRSNMNILTATYVSMLLMTTVLSFIVSIFVMIFLLFFSIGINFPFVTIYDGGIFIRLLKVFWVLIAIPLVTGFSFYFYPWTEKKGLSTKIDQELPFVAINMGSIAGSGIEPTQIFRIIAKSKEYKNTRGEIKKLLNQVNVYGYDLITSLKNVAKSTPSKKLSELLGGLAAAINSGGDVKNFFEKRAESLLLEYRLEREKFTKTAETFMDIYISLAVATPMIMLLLLVMVSVANLGIGLGVVGLSVVIIGAVALINVIFLAVLTIKQPAY